MDRRILEIQRGAVSALELRAELESFANRLGFVPRSAAGLSQDLLDLGCFCSARSFLASGIPTEQSKQSAGTQILTRKTVLPSLISSPSFGSCSGY